MGSILNQICSQHYSYQEENYCFSIYFDIYYVPGIAVGVLTCLMCSNGGYNLDNHHPLPVLQIGKQEFG